MRLETCELWCLGEIAVKKAVVKTQTVCLHINTFLPVMAELIQTSILFFIYVCRKGFGQN